MGRFVTIHGHFYQPPRENPWLDAVELQDGASPFHDWNERITAECYRPNAWARIVDREGWIEEIRSNYSRMSFNVGPTLLSWMEQVAPDVYRALLRADQESQPRFGGHGSAIAQAYHHQILPWATPKDQRTQVRWGIRDFRRRFGREPEGMWLPETAVDLPVLSILAEEGIRYTILAPSQAARVRPSESEDWTNGSDGFASTRPYRVRLPGSDRSLAVFFYDGPISHDLAFGGVLNDGMHFADRLRGGFSMGADTEDELVHIATDGETYGHHHHQGEMALAVALRALEGSDDVRLTNYGQYLADHPATWEAEIHERTAWSCAHGIERWHSNCGCNGGAHAGWQQTWRTPLRESFDWLRDTLYPLYEETLRPLLTDPWRARDEYVDFLGVERKEGVREKVDEFLAGHAARPLSAAETQRVLELLEMQRHVQQMYTSCGWFFDDLGGIETVQCLRYAARAIQLAERSFGREFEGEFRRRLSSAHGNVGENGNGSDTYAKLALTARIDLANVAAHYALSALFEEYGDHAQIYGYTVDRRAYRVLVSGTARLTFGQATVVSDRTREVKEFAFAALHIGGHNLLGGVRPLDDAGAFDAMAGRLAEPFETGDVVGAIRAVEEEFGHASYSLRGLFRDEQAKIVALLLEATLQSVETSFRQIYETTAPILRYLADAQSEAPEPLRVATEFFANERVKHSLKEKDPPVAEAAGWLRQLVAMGLRVDSSGLGFVWSRAAERALDAYLAAPEEETRLTKFEELLDLSAVTPLDLDFSGLQNRYVDFLNGPFAQERSPSQHPDEAGAAWWERYRRLGERLRVRVP